MKFLDEFKKNTSKKIAGVSTSAEPPTLWIDTGNFLLNKLISGHYRKGIAVSRLAMLAGPSASGKSFLAANMVKAAQKAGFGTFIIDSENALDDDFMRKIGANPDDPNYVYRGVSTIQNAVEVISKFLASYRKLGETTPFLILVDSLDAMMTENQKTTYDKGETKGEQGQQAKQLKAMLTPIMHDVKDLNIAILCTKQVYKEQDAIKAKNPATAFSFTDALKFPFTQILTIWNFMLKDETAKVKTYDGISLKAFAFKTRFTKPFQQVLIEVPYSVGMDPYNGLLEVAATTGVVSHTKGSSWYEFNGTKFQKKNFPMVQEQVLEALIAKGDDDVVALDFDDIEGQDVDEG